MSIFRLFSQRKDVEGGRGVIGGETRRRRGECGVVCVADTVTGCKAGDIVKRDCAMSAHDHLGKHRASLLASYVVPGESFAWACLCQAR